MTNHPLVRRSPVPPYDCNLAKSFAMIGDKWSLLVLRAALYGLRRFEDFQAELDIPRTVLSDRLSKLVGNELLEKRSYHEPGSRARPEYWLTEKGQALRLPFLAMTEWGDRWIGGDRPPPMILKERNSGSRLHIGMVKESGVEVLTTDIVAEFSKRSKPKIKRT
jgi:DNA-binding HxlR family transcriptional regulator